MSQAENATPVAEPASSLDLLETLSNWGRWGATDQLGTLNLVTPQVRRAAVAAARTGRSVSLARDVVPGRMPYAVGATAVQRHMLKSGAGAPAGEPAGAWERLELAFHGRYVTHLDSPAHVFHDGRLYNGAPAALVSAEAGATTHAVTLAGGGILTRGVLLDVARHRRTPALPDGTAVPAAELDEVARAQGVTVRPGDAVLLRTGHGRQVADWRPGDAQLTGYAGWGVSCLTWLREHDIALAGADTAQDPVPAPPGVLTSPLHVVGIVALGLWLLDNCDLEELSRVAAAEGRWEFLLSVAPLRLSGGTGSPVNPIAIF